MYVFACIHSTWNHFNMELINRDSNSYRFRLCVACVLCRFCILNSRQMNVSNIDEWFAGNSIRSSVVEWHHLF